MPQQSEKCPWKGGGYGDGEERPEVFTLKAYEHLTPDSSHPTQDRPVLLRIKCS